MLLTILPFSPALHRNPTALLALEVSGTAGGYPLPSEMGTTPERAQAWLHNTESVGRWVALLGEDTVGHVHLGAATLTSVDFVGAQGAKGPFLEVDKLLVKTRHRRQGIATALLRSAVDYAHDHGHQALLSVPPGVAPFAVALCHHLGFTDQGMLRTERGERQIFLA